MRFGMIAAAAVALACAGQADAARYYEFEIRGLAELASYSPPGTQVPNLLFDSDSKFTFDTAMGGGRYYVSNGSYGVELTINASNGSANIQTSNFPAGPLFNLLFNANTLGTAFSAIPPSDTSFTYRYRPDGRYQTTVDTFQGSLVTFIGRTTDVAPQNMGLIDRLTITAVPEPATWGMMILGVGMVGAAVRRRSRTSAAATA